LSEWTVLLEDEGIRHWIWWTVIPLSIIIGLVIVSVAEKFFDRKNTRETSKYARDDKD